MVLDLEGFTNLLSLGFDLVSPGVILTFKTIDMAAIYFFLVKVQTKSQTLCETDPRMVDHKQLFIVYLKYAIFFYKWSLGDGLL